MCAVACRLGHLSTLPRECAFAEPASSSHRCGSSRKQVKQRCADAFADPPRLDPEIVEPADLALVDERRPADEAAVDLGDVELLLAQPGRREVETLGPVADDEEEPVLRGGSWSGACASPGT
jgi:hypothetical protein